MTGPGDLTDEDLARSILPPENWPDAPSGAGTVWTGRRKAIVKMIAEVRAEATLAERERWFALAESVDSCDSCEHYKMALMNAAIRETPKPS